MRAVVDTNIIVRATIRPRGSVAPVLTRLDQRAYVLLHNPPLLDELADVLTRPRIRVRRQLTARTIRATLALVTSRGERVVVTRRIAVCRDPNDDKFLEVAVNGRADVIVSGDKDLLVLDPLEGIPIVTPARFLAMLDQPSADQ